MLYYRFSAHQPFLQLQALVQLPERKAEASKGEMYYRDGF